MALNLKPDDWCEIWRSKLRWIDKVEEGLKTPDIKKCRGKTLYRDEWSTISRNAKARIKGCYRYLIHCLYGMLFLPLVIDDFPYFNQDLHLFFFKSLFQHLYNVFKFLLSLPFIFVTCPSHFSFFFSIYSLIEWTYRIL